MSGQVVKVGGKQIDFSDWQPSDTTVKGMAISSNALQCLVLDIDKKQAAQLELYLGGVLQEI